MATAIKSVSASDLETKLNFLIDRLKPKSDYTHKSNILANKIFDILRSNESGYKIGWVKIAGSMAKQTGLVESSDYDLVVYLNDEDPPFTAPLTAFASLLKAKGFPTIETTSFSIKLNKGQVYFDIVLAKNYIVADSSELGKYKLQYERALKGLGDGDKLSAVQAVDFIYNQPEMIQRTIELAKYWNHRVMSRDKYICGRSSIIELMVVAANQEQEVPATLFASFRRFLVLMSDLTHAMVVFEKYYKKIDIPSGILAQAVVGPSIMDPVCPSNNLGKGLEPGAITEFQEKAKVTLKKWDQFEKDGTLEAVFKK